MGERGPVVFIPPQHGQSNHEVLATGHVNVNIIWGQSSERVEGCPVCGEPRQIPITDLRINREPIEGKPNA